MNLELENFSLEDLQSYVSIPNRDLMNLEQNTGGDRWKCRRFQSLIGI